METENAARDERIRVLRVAAKVAMREAILAENTKCYHDSAYDSGIVAEAAYNAALKAIDALAEAVNPG